MILITGGAGYIGSHTCVELLSQDHSILVLDNLMNASEKSLERVATLCEVDFVKLKLPHNQTNDHHARLTLVEGDIRDKSMLAQLFSQFDIEAVIHFAGLKAVGESVQDPLLYYNNNLLGSIVLIEMMAAYGCKKLIFSSSATVYGQPDAVPIKEDAALHIANPYGQTKWMVETILKDLVASDPTWSVGILRYFNPVGAHPSGQIGEDPTGIPNNLMPYIAQVAIGQRKTLSVFGTDYPTKDGTGVRDYIHVVDLAQGHCKALLKTKKTSGIFTANLGTGRGHSVLDVVAAFEAVAQKPIPYQMEERRAGDVAEYYADPSYAQTLLDWSAKRSLTEMCEDTWRWQSNNPKGYR